MCINFASQYATNRCSVKREGGLRSMLKQPQGKGEIIVNTSLKNRDANKRIEVDERGTRCSENQWYKWNAGKPGGETGDQCLGSVCTGLWL
jgi:hypothetical protein